MPFPQERVEAAMVTRCGALPIEREGRRVSVEYAGALNSLRDSDRGAITLNYFQKVSAQIERPALNRMTNLAMEDQLKM